MYVYYSKKKLLRRRKEEKENMSCTMKKKTRPSQSVPNDCYGSNILSPPPTKISLFCHQNHIALLLCKILCSIHQASLVQSSMGAQSAAVNTS